jgi:LysR family pca operon transcriptional activator
MLDARLKLRHLQALVSLSARGSVLASADELSRTPSAVSKALAELEAIVGERLFTRTRRGLLPTPVGERLLGEVQRGLGVLGDALDQACGRTRAAGAPVVTLGVLPTAASAIAPGAVCEFQALHPDTRVRVIEGTNVELLERLRQRELDVVIGRLADTALMFDLSFEPLYDEPLIAVAAPTHPLAQAHRVRPAGRARRRAGPAAAPGPRLTLRQVAAYPVVLPDAGTIVRANLDPVLLAGGVLRPPRLIETVSVPFARQLVATSEVVWFCMPGVVMQDLAGGQLVALDLDLGATRRSVGLSLRADMRPGTAAAEMADLLRAQARRVRAGLGRG